MTRDCRICLAGHDEKIHAATIRIHEWFRAQVTKHQHDAADAPMPSEEAELGTPQPNAA